MLGEEGKGLAKGWIGPPWNRQDAGPRELGFELGRGRCVEPVGPSLPRNAGLASETTRPLSIFKWLLSAGLCRGKACVPHFVDVEMARGSDSDGVEIKRVL